MKKHREISPEAFEKMLSWLNADREAAGQKYEKIRFRLMKLFRFRRCANPEELADQVFDRVALKIDELAAGFEGDPISYFLAVANYIYLESLKKPQPVELPETLAETVFAEDDRDPYYECLKKCLGALPDEKRRLVLGYYREEKRAKINLRQQLAESVGVSVATLHTQIFRLRSALQRCVSKCVGQPG